MMKGILHSLIWVVEFAVGLAFIAAVLIFIMPWLLSMDGTRETLLRLFRKPLKADVSITKAHLSWWDYTKLEGLSYKATDGKLSFSCKELSTPSSLWKIFFGEHDLGELTVDSPCMAIYLDQPEETAKLATCLKAGFASNLSIPFFADLDLHNVWGNLTPHLRGMVNLFAGQVLIEGENIDNVRLEDLSFEAKLAKGSDQLLFKLEGVTRQGDKTGSLDWSGNFGSLQSANPSLVIRGELKKLPLVGIDQIITFFHPTWHNVALTTIGPDIDLHVQCMLSNDRLDLSFIASSMLFNANLVLVTQENTIALSAPARLGLTLTPYLADAFFSLGPYMRGLSLANSPRVTVDISELNIPIAPEKGIDWGRLKIKALMNLLDMKFATPVLFKGIALERLQATLSTGRLDQELLFDTTTTLSLDDKKAFIAASGVLTHTLEEKTSMTLALSTQSFPVMILDRIFATKGFLQDALGSTCDFTCAIDRDKEERTGTLYFLSPTVSVKDANFHLSDNGSSLMKPVHLLFFPSREFWEKHAGGIGTGQIDIMVEKLDTNRFDFSKLQMLATATSPMGFYGHFSLPNPLFRCTIQTFSSIALELQSEGLKGTATLQYDGKKKTLSLVEPLNISCHLTPEEARTLWKEFSTPLLFLSPVIADASIKPFSTQLGQNLLNNVTIEGKFHASTLAVQAPNKMRAVIKDASSQLLLDTKNGQLIGKFDAMVGSEEASLIPLHSECIVRKLHFQPKINMADAEYLFKMDFSRLDTRFIDAWQIGKAPLSPLLGKWVTLKADLLKGSSSGSLALEATCEKGSLQCNLAKQNDLLSLSKGQPLKASLTLDKEGFEALERFTGQAWPIDLAAPSLLDIQMDRLNLPLKTGQWAIDQRALSQATLSCLFQTASISFIESATNKPIALNQLAFRLSKMDAQSPIALNLKASIDAAKPGQVDVKVNLDGIQNTDKGWDFSKTSAQIDANFQQVPTSVTDTLTLAMGWKTQPLTALLGDQISGSATAKIENCSGPITIVLNSPSSRFSLNGVLQKGILLLNQPFIAQVTMTEELSRNFLRGINPLSIAAVQSDGPMTLFVDKEGFSLPIFPWDIQAASIPHARLELGRILCRNQGNIHTALDLLKLGQFSRSNTLTLWFAPLDFSLKEGVLDCERTEFLVSDSIDLATWGEVDLVNNRVDAVLGLTAQALSKAFGIKDLPETYVLQIPMRGPIDNVKIDTGKATAKIALLLAWQKASSSAGSIIGGSQGALVGGLLGQLAKLPDGNTKAPPAKHPFPWEKQPPSPSTMPPKKKKSAIKPGDKPLKQLIKLFK